jgi:patatin-like phospholipase/acyl hydrolase
MENKPFKILSIDGGGIRGVFPAMILTLLENELKNSGRPDWKIRDHFNLICGTSTGGILGIALSLGIPAEEIYKMYLENAGTIFGKKKSVLMSFMRSAHDRKPLESIIRRTFQDYFDGKDPRIDDGQTPLCIPVYDLLNGAGSVIKTRHHEKYTRDYHIPAYQAALATSAAPTYFDPYSAKYGLIDSKVNRSLTNRVDGGVIANNPALIGIYEAIEAFDQPLSSIRLLSLGTGTRKYSDANENKGWGYYYWIAKRGRKGQIIDLFMQGQSQMVENQISLMQNGIDRERAENPSFIYQRINTSLGDDLKVELDETDKKKLEKLAERAAFQFNNHASILKTTFCK